MGIFKSRTPTSLSPDQGESFNQILAARLGKKPGEQVTAQELMGLIQSSGLSGRGARQVMSGARRFLANKGGDYRLMGDGSYNVFQGRTPNLASSKVSGNKKGLDLGDLIGLGNNTSKFAGFVEGLKSSKPAANTEFQAPAATPGAGQAPPAPTPPVNNSRGGGKKGGAPVSAGATFNADDFVVKRPELGFPKSKGLQDAIGKALKNPALSTGSQQGQGQGKVPTTLEQDVKHYAAAFNRAVLDLPGEILRGPASLGNLLGFEGTDQYLTKQLGDKYSDFVLNSKFGDFASAGFDPSRDDWGTKAIQFIPALMATRGTPSGRTITANAGKGVAKVAGAAANTTKAAATKIGSKAATAGEYLYKVPTKMAINRGWVPSMADDIGIQMEKLVAQPKLKPGTSKAVKEASDNMLYESGKFKNGGKVVWGGKVKQYSSGGELLARAAANLPKTKLMGYNPDGSEIYDFETGDTSGQTAGIARGITPRSATNTNFGGNFETQAPGTGGGGGKAGTATFGDVAGKVAKYSLPFIGEFLNRGQLDQAKPAPFKTGDLDEGVVYDMPRPNMRLRYRQPVGPDMMSEIAGQKFADAQQMEKEKDFHIQNAMSRIGQRQQITQNRRQNKMFNLQGERMYDLYSNQNRLSLAQLKGQSMAEPFIAAQQHLGTDISTGAALKEDRRALSAEQLLKYGDPNSEQYKRALRYIEAGFELPGEKTATGKKGMKFKTKC